MLELFKNLFFLGQLIPGHCSFWQPALVWLHIISDSLIAIACYSIPLVLLYFVRKRQDLRFKWILFVPFGGFIASFGTTHILEIWTLWHPTYWLSGVLKAITASISLYSVAMLVPLVPKAIALPSPAELEAANRKLEREINERKRIEQERNNFFNLSPDLLCITNFDGYFKYANPAWEKLTGFTTEELLTKPYIEVIYPEDRKALAADAQKVALGIETTSFESRLLCKDGSYKWLAWSAIASREQRLMYVIGRDITKRKQVEATLQESEERFRNLVEASTDLVWEMDENALYTYISPKIREILGYEPEEVLGKTPFDLMPPEETFRVANIFGPIAAARQAFSFLENTNIHKDGHVVVLERSGVPFFDADGIYKGYRGIDRDITQRQQVEEELRISQARFAGILDLADDAIISIDEKQRITLFNKGAERIFNYSAAEVINQPIEQLLPSMKALGSSAGIASSIGDRKEVFCRRKDRTKFAAEVSISKLELREEKIFTIILRDISDRKRGAEALQESYGLLRTVIESIPDMVFVKDLQGRWVMLNSTVARFIGKPMQEIIGKNDTQLWPSEIAHQLREKDLEIMTRGVAETFEEIVVSNNGLTQTFLTTKCPWYDPQKNIIGLIAIARDISDRKQAEAALRESEERFRSLSACSPVGIFMADVNGRCTYTNPRCQAICGFTSAQALGEGWTQLIHPEDREWVVADWLAAVAAGRQCFQEYRFQTPEGVVRWIHARTSPLLSDRGQLIGHVGTIQDITEHKQAEEALRQSEERHRHLVESCPDGIFIQIDGKFVFVNNAAVKFYGAASSEELIGKSVLDFVHPQYREIVSERMRQLAQGNKTAPFLQQQLCRLDGTVVDAEVTAISFIYEGQTATQVVIRDITERKQVEEALRQSEARFRAAAEASLDAFFLFQSLRDENGTIVDFTFVDLNSRGEEMISMSKEETIGKRLCELLPINRTGGFFEKYVRVVETGEVLAEEFPVTIVEDKALWLQHQVVPLADGIAITCRDISDAVAAATQRKQAEEAIQQANEQLINLVSNLEHRNQEITLLIEMSHVLQACLTVEEAYSAIAKLVQPMFPHINGAVFIINESKTVIDAVAAWGSAIASQRLFAPQECWALRRGRVHWVEDTHGSLVCNHLHYPLPASSLCIPLMAQGDALGLLYLSSQDRERLTEAKQQLAVAVAEHMALALANLKLRQTLQYERIRDPLTGLFNRRYLEESLVREVSRAERSHQPLGIIMLDIDHFKRFNDTFGHAAGDAVLRELGSFLKTSIRAGDIACRYGGEELTLILPGASLEVSNERAEQLRQGVKLLSVEHGSQSLGSITLSLGVACFPEDGLTGEAVMQAADAALYRAKAEGRDRVSLSR